jgi:hypothetical protein
MSGVRTHLIFPAALVVVCCTAQVVSNLRINGAPYTLTRCVSGQTRGFPGVELADERGSRLRLATNIDGSAIAAYFPRGSTVGEYLGSCVSLRLEPGTGVINGARNTDGVATLACRTEQYWIEGTVRFENCH